MAMREGCTVPGLPAWTAILEEQRQVLQACENLQPVLEAAAMSLRECLARGGRILICGNGGSHAHAQHFAAELVVRFKRNREPMAALALGCNAAVTTAVINDLDPRDIFVREARALLRPGDALIGISTSGVSANVCRALATANDMLAITVGLTGLGEMDVDVVHEIRIPCKDTARIQEAHMLVLHWLCEALDA